MNKLTIPALLLGVVMVAGAFAFMPVQEASTVHTSTTSTENSIKYFSVTKTCTATGDDNCSVVKVDIPTDAVYKVVSMSVTTTEVGSGGTIVMDYDDCKAAGIVTGMNVLDAGAGNAATVTLIDNIPTSDEVISIGTSVTNDIACTGGVAGAVTTSADDIIKVTIVVQINADAADPTMTLTDVGTE